MPNQTSAEPARTLRVRAFDVPKGAHTAGDGLIIVDKPQGLSSHDVVARVRRLAATKKVGHAGTLDPMATGVLICGVGRATRLLTYIVGADKTYQATIRLGQATSTDDAEGEILETRGANLESVEEKLRPATAQLTGNILQVPSSVSAIKVDGQRAYARVRAGEDVKLAARPVTVTQFDVCGAPREVLVDKDTKAVDIDVEVTCSSGTYIRALARDLGAALGVGGHLTSLRRTRVGSFDLSSARSINELAEQVAQANEASQAVQVMAMNEALPKVMECITLPQSQAEAFRHGQAPKDLYSKHEQCPEILGVLDGKGRALGVLGFTKGQAKTLLVLAPAGCD
ncbi:MAG: tRNA pseudouridine(55) synthase TruB [Actinomycetaceae bacterium]|nr:tRNA pseudouridine(55) synthase TruB [Actinomycetaceae bacterium]